MVGRWINNSCGARRSLVRTYIEDIETHSLLCTPSDHHRPTSISILRIASSQLYSPSMPSAAGFCRIATCCRRQGSRLVGSSFSHSSRARRRLVQTYIEDIKPHTSVYTIRPPPFNLHSYPVDSIQCVLLTVSASEGVF